MIKRGMLSDCFVSVAAKKLSAVEANPEISNQHEFNGSRPLRRMFEEDDRLRIQARFVWLNDYQEGATDEGFVSWYDSRKNQPHRSAEYRLYYPANAVSGLMKEGDTLFIALRPEGDLFVIVTPAGSEIGNQIGWLFGLESEPQLEFETRDLVSDTSAQLDFAARFILDELGIDFEIPESDFLDTLLKQFESGLPTTKQFAEFARKTVRGQFSPVEEPDSTLMAWLDHEEKLFRRHEHFTIARRLEAGFAGNEGTDVEGFLKFSLSVQNARKTRMGWSLEHHAEAIFKACELQYSRGQFTEYRNKPDFLFPGIAEYRDPTFAPSRLTMLASKSTCKDRWRQALSEAERIPRKHMLTLEPSISQNQTDEMQAKGLRLVVPRRLHSSFNDTQQAWLMDMASFVALARERQVKS